LSYASLIDGETYYLTWKYNGVDLINKTDFIMVLLPYKNKQNEFKLHFNDSAYLKPFYEKFNLYNREIGKFLNQMTYVTSDYNINKDHYLELEKIDSKFYIVKASPWSVKCSGAYLHTDKKNKLYFDERINENIARFLIEST
jgi:hypothetical protein